jgi:hypothetical protein
MNGHLYYAPARNYHGKTLVRVNGITTDTRGQTMLEVEAVNGKPWDDAGMWGYSPTNRAKFYPEHINAVNENATSEMVTLSHFEASNLLNQILTDLRSAK